MALVIVLCVGYNFGIMKCDIDYYIGFFDCGIWLLILDRMDGRNWEEVWKELEEEGKILEVVEGGGWRCGVW